MEDTRLLSERTAEEIRVVMTRRKVSGRQLAAALGVSQTWMSTRLNGTVPIDLNELQRFAEVLNVEVTELLPRPMPGRVVATVPTTSDRPNVHSDASPVRTTRRRSERKANPIGRSRRESTAPASAVPPTQRRPALISGPGQRMAA